ncbi:ABC transporter permease [Rhodococcus sp. NCIMB 12038]|uniref:ABC transporter permease n=1 Tax=Rhodococcus sp. NCIMB 12038 TaxID=933800 RepID=UPI0015C68771|nr:ABC transporter permease [Rhodococcus sp. NCIMB 12038]
MLRVGAAAAAASPWQLSFVIMTGGIDLAVVLLAFGRHTYLGLTTWTWRMFLAFGVGAFALKYSAWARRVLAIGGNEESAHLLGVRTTGTMISVYVLSGLAAGSAGSCSPAKPGRSAPTPARAGN